MVLAGSVDTLKMAKSLKPLHTRLAFFKDNFNVGIPTEIRRARSPTMTERSTASRKSGMTMGCFVGSVIGNQGIYMALILGGLRMVKCLARQNITLRLTRSGIDIS